MVLVLSDVGQMREIAERADDADGLSVRQTADDRLELLARGGVGIAMKPKRGLTDPLDCLEDVIAFLRAHGFTEDTAEEPYVVSERRILVGVLPRLLHRAGVLAQGVRASRQERRFMDGCASLTGGIGRGL